MTIPKIKMLLSCWKVFHFYSTLLQQRQVCALMMGTSVVDREATVSIKMLCTVGIECVTPTGFRMLYFSVQIPRKSVHM